MTDGGLSHINSYSTLTWTPEQLKVINVDRSERQLVQAGPGTGKTAVACARVAHLIEIQNVLPHEIFLISFTNAAIHELRSRIRSYLSDPDLASGLRITTIDSFSASLQSGFVPDATFSGDFTQSIQSTSDLIFTNLEALEYIKNVQHLIVDEAQDISGARTELILNLIYKFEATTGVTVFYDSAQAIYGFAGDGEESFPGIILPKAISEYNESLSLNFSEKVLVKIHRTNDEKLLNLFDHGRISLNTSEASASDIYSETREIINSQKHLDVGSFDDLLQSGIDLTDALVLFRSRVETLSAASSMGIQKRRIRLPGMTVPLEPWIARALFDWGSDPEDKWDGVHIEKEQFLELFPRRIPKEEFDAYYAWELLLRHAGVDQNRVSLRTLLEKLSRQNPPLDFCMPEFGHGGPIFSTIHRAKGREAEEVFLYMPKIFSMENKSSNQILEEARVLFVGATRAKSSLGIGKPRSFLPRFTAPSGRAFAVTNRQGRMARFEIGRKLDLNATFIVGKNYVGYNEVDELHRFLWKSRNTVVPLNAYTVESNGTYRYEVKVDASHSEYTGKRVCWFDNHLTSDLWAMARELQPGGGLKVPEYFLNFHSLGTSTIVVPPNSIDLKKLHHPWSQNGLALAPMLSGFPMTMFPFARRKF
jgi:hypothetical protein